MWKRRLAIAACVLIVLFLGLFFYLGSSHVAGQVRQRLQALLGVGVDVQSARIGMVFSSSARDVAVHEANPTIDAPLLRVERADLDLTLAGVLGGGMPTTVDLRGADLILRFAETGKLLTALPRPKPGGGSMPIIRFHRGRLTLDQQGRNPFVLTGLDVTLTAEGTGFVLAGTVADPDWGEWTVAGEIQPEQGSFVLRLTTPATDVTPERLQSLPFVSPTVWKAVEVRGTTGVEFTLRVPFGLAAGERVRYRVDLDIARADLVVPSIELRPTDLVGRTIVEDGVVELRDLHGHYAGGNLRTTGRLDFRTPPSQLQFNIAAEDVRLEVLPRSWKLPEGLQGLVDMKADLVVRLEKTGVQTTGSGQGEVSRAVYGAVGLSKPIPIKLLAEGSRFRFRPILPSLLPGGIKPER